MENETIIKNGGPNLKVLIPQVIIPPILVFAFFLIFQEINPEIIGVELTGTLNFILSILVLIVFGFSTIILILTALKIMANNLNNIFNNQKEESKNATGN